MLAHALGKQWYLGRGVRDICLPFFITLPLARGYSLVNFKTCFWSAPDLFFPFSSLQAKILLIFYLFFCLGSVLKVLATVWKCSVCGGKWDWGWVVFSTWMFMACCEFTYIWNYIIFELFEQKKRFSLSKYLLIVFFFKWRFVLFSFELCGHVELCWADIILPAADCSRSNLTVENQGFSERVKLEGFIHVLSYK